MTPAPGPGALLPTLMYPLRTVAIPCVIGFLSTVFYFGFGFATGFVAATLVGLGLLLVGLAGAVLTPWLQVRVRRSGSLVTGRLLVFGILAALGVLVAVAYLTYTMVSANQSLVEIYPLISVLAPSLIVYIIVLAITVTRTVQLSSRGK